MSRRPEPVQVVKQRRDAALQKLVGSVPYIQFLGVKFDRRGDELTAILNMPVCAQRAEIEKVMPYASQFMPDRG